MLEWEIMSLHLHQGLTVSNLCYKAETLATNQIPSHPSISQVKAITCIAQRRGKKYKAISVYLYEIKTKAKNKITIFAV